MRRSWRTDGGPDKSVSGDADLERFQNRTNILKKSPASISFEGCYLYYFESERVWIRSGKVTGRSFEARHKEHRNGSKLRTLADMASNFYSTYPSESVKDENKPKRIVDFEQLKLFSAFAFDRNSKKHKQLYEVGDGAIFDWNQDILKRLGEVNLQEKQLTLLSYLFELLYDLALSSNWNASRSPGFETPLGWFEKRLN
jgi:hypothetical protein